MNAASGRAVVVGIDGSAASREAAVWAIDEAESRDATLRPIVIVDSSDMRDRGGAAHRMASAQEAMRHAVSSIEATGRPVRIEGAIMHGRPVQTLLRESQTAVLLCVGARGLRHATEGRIGSTAAALSAGARCPVAIVRSRRAHQRRPRCVVVELADRSVADALLDCGLEEAQRHGSNLRVLAPSSGATTLKAHWQRRVDDARRRFPHLDIASVTGDSDALAYLAANAADVEVMVTSRNRRGGLADLVSAPGNAALRDTDCSILICGPQTAL
ncbi:universal stress protein [Mycolicibacterium sp. 018/SC-01/001]|uniref:universal stress protein n=1 Tax=Mycolicibacterium sp. 018/SC-01/001 TaxID=2592069 RepID=UPI00117F6A7D|nr:universal stress protein [Mycolicibacterium sp. 018/SC-01/001]TRW84801.1 universal stress protein [Mycolicibacterium sp. 018/SC-01/001]